MSQVHVTVECEDWANLTGTVLVYPSGKANGANLFKFPVDGSHTNVSFDVPAGNYFVVLKLSDERGAENERGIDKRIDADGTNKVDVSLQVRKAEQKIKQGRRK